MKISLFVTILLTAISTSKSFAQTNEQIPLVLVLDSLEHKFDVKFSYVNDHIQDLYSDSFPECLEIEQCIQMLEREMKLKFEVLNERFITIAPIEAAHQSLCVDVFDQETKQRIEDAVILLKDRLVSSDINGVFIINQVELGDTLTIRHLGYKPKKIVLRETKAEKCLEISLSPVITMLEEVRVQNFLIRGIDKKADGSTSIDLQHTEILPGLTEPDVLQTVQNLPGIQSVNEKVSDINVRGGTNDQNLVLWEGVKMYQTGHFFGLISAFNPHLIEKVSLLKNGSSAAYNEGVSSIIDIKTFDELNKQLEVGAGANMINADAFIKIPISKKIGLHLSGRRSFADAVNSPTFSRYFERAFRDSEVAQFVNGTDTLATNDNFYFYDYSAKLLYDISPHDRLRISFLNIFNQINYQESKNVTAGADSKNSELQQSNIAASAKYEREWNKQITTSLSVNLSSYNLKSLNVDFPNDQQLFQQNEVLDINMKSSISWKVANNYTLKTGYQLNEVGVTSIDELNNPTFRRFKKEVLRIHGQFTEIGYVSKGGNTISTMGLRLNYFDKFNKFRLEPRIAVNQLISEHISLELLAEAKSQATTQIIDFQTDFLGVEERRWVLVNEEDIPLVTSGQLSLGAHYKKNDLLISVEGYLKQVDGIITSSQGFQNQLEFLRSSGSYTSQGIDVLLNDRVGDLNFWTSYSYSKNTYNFPLLEPSRFPNNLDIRHASTLGLSYQFNHLELSAGLNYRSGRPKTEPEEILPIIDGNINYQFPNSSRIGHYLRPDFSAKYHFVTREKLRTEIALSVWNFTNQRNVVNRYYIINQAKEIQRVDELGLGLTPNLMLRVVF